MRHLVAVASVVLLSAGPVMAEPERRAPNHKDPAIAAGLSLTPLVVGLTGMALAANNPSYIGLHPVIGLSSLAFPGLGHFYAGDPLRGTLVTLGSPVVTLGGGLAVGAVYGQLSPGPWQTFVGFVYGAMACGAAYTLWSSYDAYHTAERRNQEERDYYRR